jgi:hypothetical protein
MPSGTQLFAVCGGRVALRRPLMLRLSRRSQPGPARITFVDAPASVYGTASVTRSHRWGPVWILEPF